MIKHCNTNIIYLPFFTYLPKFYHGDKQTLRILFIFSGIQQYLFENGRIDNIFTDPYYEKFTDCLDEVARKFSVLYNDSREYFCLM